VAEQDDHPRRVGPALRGRGSAGPDELGLEGADEAIVGRQYADAVADATAQAHSVGINAIPAFVLDRRLLVLGAQPDEVFERAFAQLAGDAAAGPRDPDAADESPARPG